MSFYSHALFQELSRDLARVIDSSPLYIRRSAPLTPAAQSAYVTSLASQLLVAIRTFVTLHPNIHTNSTPPDVVINLLLADLLSHGTITPALHCHIIEQLLYSSRQDLISTLFQNYNQFRPNLPQVTFVRSDVAVRSPTAVVPINEVAVNPPFDIIDTQTAQTSTILSQLSVPNSQGSSPSTHHRPHAHRIRYDPISDLLPPHVGDFASAKVVVEQVFSGCPKRASPTTPIFKSRPGHLSTQRNWQCNCGLIVQARKSEDHPNLVTFFIPSGQDLPHQGAAPEPAVQTPSTLSLSRGGRPSSRSDNVQDTDSLRRLSDSQKDVINGLLENQPSIQPLRCWGLLRRILPTDPLFRFDGGGIDGYYLIQAYMRYLRRSALPTVGFGYRILDFSTISTFIHQHSLLAHLTTLNYTPRSIHEFRTFHQLLTALNIADSEHIYTVPLSDEFVASLGANEQETRRARAHILLMNAGSLWSILLYLKQPEHQRILTMDFSTGFLADNASVGQVCALQLLVDHYDPSKLRQRAHPLAYSVTYETKAQVRVAHHLIGVVAAKLFQEPWTVARQIADRSTSIISGTTLSHPNSVVYPCMIHFRLSPHNSPIWRKHIHNFKTFEIFLHVFVTRMTTVFRTDAVRKKALAHFTTDCNHEDIDEGDFSDFFNRNYGPDKPLFGLLSKFSIHMAGYKMDNQAHESGYRKQKGSARLGVPPIGPLNQSLSGFLGNTVRELMGHDLGRVSRVTSFQLDPTVRVARGYSIPQSILCELALADSRIDVRPVTHQFLRDLCPDICDAWFLELGVALRSPITLCWVVNGLPTFGRTISDDRIVQFLRSHFDETYDPFPFNKFYAVLSYDLFFCFSSKARS